MRWVARQNAKQGPDPAWVATFIEAIVKASLSFLAKFWWAIMRLWIWPMLANNNLMLDYVILVASILASCGIDWANLIADQIHEADLKRTSFIPFPYLIYKLCLESGGGEFIAIGLTN